MKSKIFAVAFAAASLALIVGCVSTMDGHKQAAVPFQKDTIEARYERPMTQVYTAAKEVVAFNGAIINETILHGQTNAVDNVAKVIQGKVNQRTVWVRVMQIDPKTTAVSVQVRTSGGGADIDLAAEIDKQIALKLVR
ncbi:MAG: DUF3568 family protein [Verrucomicrobiota bacterium]